MHVASLEATQEGAGSVVRFWCTTAPDDPNPYIAARMDGPQEAERELHDLLLTLSGKPQEEQDGNDQPGL